MSAGQQMLLASKGNAQTVNINDQSINHTTGGGGAATATYKLNSTGIVQDHVPNALETWLLGGVNSDYEVQVTGSGTITGSATGTWLGLGTTRAWSTTAAIGQIKTATLTVEIRRAVSPFDVLDTATAELTADALP